MKNVPKIAAVHDISGIGRCSMTVILPVMSALGCQVCPLPTALLSNHSEYEHFYFFDFTDYMDEYYRCWEKNNAWFDCIYTGFIGSEKQINLITEIINKMKKNNSPLIVVDPVMGDHGEVYKTYTSKMVKKMECLVSRADIITPNLTEASILLSKSYSGETISTEQLKEYLSGLCNLGPDISLITGITTDNGEHINACCQKSTNRYWKVSYEYLDTGYPGTGDLFTALFTGYLLNGEALPEAMEDASIFVSKAVHATYEAKTPKSEGVLFEKVMRELYAEHTNYKYSEI